MTAFKRHSPGCGCPCGCASPIRVDFVLQGGCCPGIGFTGTVYPHESVDPIGSCSGVNQSCQVPMPDGTTPGTMVDWTMDVPGLATASGTLTLACGSNVITRPWVDLLPDTIHVTDPLGNAVPLLRAGAAGTLAGRRWEGSWAYVLTNAYGCDPLTVTVGYTWGGGTSGCTLGLSTDIPHVVAWAMTATLPAGDIYFCTDNSLRGSPTPPGSVPWARPGTDPERECAPPLIQYLPWVDRVFYSGINDGFQASSFGCNAVFWNPFTVPGPGPGGVCAYSLFQGQQPFTVTT